MWNTIQLFSKKFFDCLSTTFTKTLFNVAQFTWVSYILHFSSVCNVCIVIGFWVSKHWTPAKRISSLGCHDLLLLTNCLSVFDHFVGLALKALILVKHILTHFTSFYRSYTPWKRQINSGFLTISVGIGAEHWSEIGKFKCHR